MVSAKRLRGNPAPELDLAAVMRVLGDQARLEIVRLLSDGRLRTTGEIAKHVNLPASTCSYHLKQLFTTGITECWSEGTARYPVLRREAIDDRFPGLITAVLADHQPAAHP
ncbi:ArsR/SmtB family transcription factor [Nocardia sp. NPDC004711]